MVPTPATLEGFAAWRGSPARGRGLPAVAGWQRGRVLGMGGPFVSFIDEVYDASLTSFTQGGQGNSLNGYNLDVEAFVAHQTPARFLGTVHAARVLVSNAISLVLACAGQLEIDGHPLPTGTSLMSAQLVGFRTGLAGLGKGLNETQRAGDAERAKQHSAEAERVASIEREIVAAGKAARLAAGALGLCIPP